MTYNLPLRLTILHFEQRFLIDAETFMTLILLATAGLNSSDQNHDYTKS
jgi:hypothetical protein